ncbi:hypothetical protein ACUY4R_000311 [Kosakonia sp. BK9b]
MSTPIGQNHQMLIIINPVHQQIIASEVQFTKTGHLSG